MSAGSRAGHPPTIPASWRTLVSADVELILIRHALPVRQETIEGPADPPLAPLGVDQATALAAIVGPDDFDALYVSPLLRARQTADPLAERTGLDPTVVDGLAEWDRHARSYVPLEELRREAPEVIEAMAKGQWSVLGIDMDTFVARVNDTIDDISGSHRGQRVAMVCHGGVINAYLSQVLGLASPLFFEPGYTSVSRVRVSSSGTRGVLSINETGHLRGLVTS
jgi:2,3-bisphosphoglycerate-dependent phosphoglycerate mutase